GTLPKPDQGPREATRAVLGAVLDRGLDRRRAAVRRLRLYLGTEKQVLLRRSRPGRKHEVDYVGVRCRLGPILLQTPLLRSQRAPRMLLRCLVEVDENLAEVPRHG